MPVGVGNISIIKSLFRDEDEVAAAARIRYAQALSIPTPGQARVQAAQASVDERLQTMPAPGTQEVEEFPSASILAPARAVGELVAAPFTVPIRGAVGAAISIVEGGIEGITDDPFGTAYTAIRAGGEAGIRPPLEGLLTVVNEIMRPQKALFAGLYELGEPYAASHPLDAMANGIIAAVDEFFAGWGTGRFKRDVFYGDLLFRNTRREDRTWWQRGLGLTGDIAVDPFNFPIVNAAPFKIAKWLYSARKSGIAFTKPSAVGTAADAVVEVWKKSFIVPEVDSIAAEATETLLQKSLPGYGEVHKARILSAYATDQRVIRDLAERMGISQDELVDMYAKHYEYTQAINPYYDMKDTVENTIARAYNEAGMAGADDWIRTAGNRAKFEDKELRRMMLRGNFDEAEPMFREAFGDDLTEEVIDLVHEMKERRLDNMVYGIKYRVVTNPNAPRNLLFTSMEKDHMALVATDEFKMAYDNVVGMVRSERGSSAFSTGHLGDLHGNLQEMGYSAANDLLRTARTKGSDESKFFVRLANREKVYMPRMDRGFHEDPSYVNAIRGYYTRMAAEKAVMLKDLVEGYGRVLPEGSFLEKGVVVAEGALKAAKDSPNPLNAIEELAETARDIPYELSLTDAAAKKLEADGLTMLRGIPGFENAAMPTEAAEMIMKVHKSYSDPELAGTVLDVLNQAQNRYWKPWTLFVYTASMTRNMVTNTMLGFAGGINTPRQYLTHLGESMNIMLAGSPKGLKGALKFADNQVQRIPGVDGLPDAVQRAIKSGEFVTDHPLYGKASEIKELMEGLNITDIEDPSLLFMIRLAVDTAILRNGQYGMNELSQTLEGGLKFIKDNPTFKSKVFNMKNIPYVGTADNSPALRVGIGGWGAIEDSQRMTLWLYAMKDKGTGIIREGLGMDILPAAQHAIKWAVNYGRLTTFERRIMKPLIPFYAFSRGATPLMFEHLISEPGKWNRLNHLRRDQEEQMYAEGEAADHALLIPEYVARGLGVPIRKGPEGEYQYRMFDNWIPQSLIAEIDSVEEIKRFFIAQNASPLIQVMAEMVFEKSLFLDTEFGKGKVSFAGLRVQPEVASFLRVFRVLGMVDMFTRQNNPGLVNNMLRFMTGFNTVRVTEEQANTAAMARISEMVREISQASVTVARLVAEGEMTQEAADKELAALREEMLSFFDTGLE